MSRLAARAVWKQLTCAGEHAPAARSSHTITAMPGGVCVFGGEDKPRNAFDPHPHFFRPDGTWLQASAPLPSLPLLGHGATSVGDRLHVFGGRLGGPNTFSGKESGESGDLFTWEAGSDTWVRWEPRGAAIPEPRSFHAMCSMEKDGVGHAIVFGGCGSTGRLNDVWSFDSAALEWRCLHPGGGVSEAPVPRGGSCIVASSDGSSLALLFGFSGAQQGDIALFDLQKGKWRVLAQHEQLGDVPSPRSVFAATKVPGRNEAVLFGGEHVESDQGHAGAGEFTSDLYVFDLERLSWQRVEAEGVVPKPRGWSGLAAMSPSRFVLFGGLDAENIRLDDTWELTLSE